MFLSLSIMLIVASAILSIAFVTPEKFHFKKYGLTLLFFIPLTITLYQLSSDQKALSEWQTTGKVHYDLLTQVESLGGITGMIDKIKARLQTDPNNPQGWEILGKLYASQGKTEEANQAFEKSKSLKQ